MPILKKMTVKPSIFISVKETSGKKAFNQVAQAYKSASKNNWDLDAKKWGRDIRSVKTRSNPDVRRDSLILDDRLLGVVVNTKTGDLLATDIQTTIGSQNKVTPSEKKVLLDMMKLTAPNTSDEELKEAIEEGIYSDGNIEVTDGGRVIFFEFGNHADYYGGNYRIISCQAYLKENEDTLNSIGYIGWKLW